MKIPVRYQQNELIQCQKIINSNNTHYTQNISEGVWWPPSNISVYRRSLFVFSFLDFISLPILFPIMVISSDCASACYLSSSLIVATSFGSTLIVCESWWLVSSPQVYVTDHRKWLRRTDIDEKAHFQFRVMVQTIPELCNANLQYFNCKPNLSHNRLAFLANTLLEEKEKA